MVRSGQTWTGMVATRDATGALVAAGVGPAGALYVNGVLNGAAVAIAGANPYSWTVTLPALAATDCVSMYITATIAGVATGAVVCEAVADTMFVSDIDLCDVWDCLIAAHLGAGTTGETLNDVCTCVINGLMGKAVISAALRSAGDLSIYRGDTWSQIITGMGDLTAVTDIWFALKAGPEDTDNEALVLISETAGLERINGTAATVPANGSITVINAAGGIIQIDLAAVETAKLAPDKQFWDCQRIVGAAVTTPKGGRCTVCADIVRATS